MVPLANKECLNKEGLKIQRRTVIELRPTVIFNVMYTVWQKTLG